MVDVRVVDGRRAGGLGRTQQLLVAALTLVSLVAALTLVSLIAAPPRALGASGGASVPGPPATHSTPHRSSPARRSRRHSALRPGNPLARRTMWIWELPQSNGGDVTSIVTAARHYGVGTLLIKSSDGTSFWSSQFTPQLVAALHAAGIKVCGWQYVYGNHPITEAYMGAQAVRDGADCLVIDAEAEYQGRYVQAQSYMTRLRTLIGAAYPLALAGFPYVDYHPAFPYSVFLGPGGAQDNVPQMYWRDIGTTTDAVFAHTYAFNEPYGRAIYPLGQLYGNPPAHQVVRFRQLSRAYGAPNVSWWDWQEASGSDWSAVSRPVGALAGYAAAKAMASVAEGAVGDLVVWIQEHLVAAGQPVTVDGGFGPSTQTAVMNFQAASGLIADGVVGPATWAGLLRYTPQTMIWGRAATAHRARMALARGGARTVTVRTLALPRSASRRERRNEIAGAGGAGGRPGR